MPASGAETSRGPPRCSSPGGDHIVPCPTGLSELGCLGVLGPPEQPAPRARPSRREGPGPRPGLPTRPVCQEVGQAPGPGGGKQVTEGREVEVAEAEAALLRTPGAPSAPPRARGPASSSQARGQRPEARDQRRPAAGRPAPGSGALSRWRTQGNAEPPFRQGTGAQGEGDRDRGQTPGLGPRRGLRHAPPPHTPPALPGPRARASDPVQPTRCPVRALGPLAGSAPVCGVSRPEACPHLGPHPPPSLPPRPSGARTDVPPIPRGGAGLLPLGTGHHCTRPGRTCVVLLASWGQGQPSACVSVGTPTGSLRGLPGRRGRRRHPYARHCTPGDRPAMRKWVPSLWKRPLPTLLVPEMASWGRPAAGSDCGGPVPSSLGRLVESPSGTPQRPSFLRPRPSQLLAPTSRTSPGEEVGGQNERWPRATAGA